jgi:hypothetical protein
LRPLKPRWKSHRAAGGHRARRGDPAPVCAST